MKTQTELFLVVLVLMLTAIGCASGTPSLLSVTPATAVFPLGTLVAGEWTWEFRADGTEIASQTGVVYENGTFMVAGNQVVFQDRMHLYCGELKGIYTWTGNGETLTFKAIDDPCTGRREAIEAAAWTRKSDSAEANITFPTGTFQAIDNTIGEFVLDAKADGTFTLLLNRGAARIDGSYSVAQNQVTFKSGPCAGPDKETGTYTWKLDGDKLLFNAVKEQCNDRWRALNLVWTKK